MFKDCLKKVMLKTRSKEEKCYLIDKEIFYKRLKEIGIRSSIADHDNLIEFLWIDAAYPNLILFKKLIRAVEAI